RRRWGGRCPGRPAAPPAPPPTPPADRWWRAPSPEIVSESTRGSEPAPSPAIGDRELAPGARPAAGGCPSASVLPGTAVGAGAPAAGLLNCDSSMATLASIRSHTICAFSAVGLPLSPPAHH